MAETDTARTRSAVVVAAVVALGGIALVALRWAPLTGLLGVVVVAVSLVLAPRVVAALGVLAVGLSAVVGVLVADGSGWQRSLIVVLAAVLGVCGSALLAYRDRGLASRRRREDEILAAMSEAVVVLNAFGILRRANAGLTRLVPAARVGDTLHPLLGHVLADGSPCQGGCALAGVRPQVQDYTPIEGERITREGRAVPIAYTVGTYGPDELVVTIRDVSARVAAQQDRDVLLAAAARTEEQGALLRALGEPRLRTSSVADVDVDSWMPEGERADSSAGLASVSSLPDGRMLLLMVNAQGVGYEPARDAWKVLYVARAHLAAGAPLAEMISRASDSLVDEANQPSATLVGALLDPVTGHLQVASGGHPPPLLIHGDGTTRWLEAEGRPLGGEFPASTQVIGAELAPSDTLLVYGLGIIDGVRDVVEGMSALRSAAVGLRGSPIDGLASRIGKAAVPPGATREQADILMALRLASP